MAPEVFFLGLVGLFVIILVVLSATTFIKHIADVCGITIKDIAIALGVIVLIVLVTDCKAQSTPMYNAVIEQVTPAIDTVNTRLHYADKVLHVHTSNDNSWEITLSRPDSTIIAFQTVYSHDDAVLTAAAFVCAEATGDIYCNP